MLEHTMIAQTSSGTEPLIWLGAIGAVILLFLFFVVFVIKQYKRCPSNRVLVIYGKVGSSKAAKCLHGGGAFVHSQPWTAAPKYMVGLAGSPSSKLHNGRPSLQGPSDCTLSCACAAPRSCMSVANSS